MVDSHAAHHSIASKRLVAPMKNISRCGALPSKPGDMDGEAVDMSMASAFSVQQQRATRGAELPRGALGHSPKLVAGAMENFKITWPADFDLAARLLRTRTP